MNLSIEDERECRLHLTHPTQECAMSDPRLLTLVSFLDPAAFFSTSSFSFPAVSFFGVGVGDGAAFSSFFSCTAGFSFSSALLFRLSSGLVFSLVGGSSFFAASFSDELDPELAPPPSPGSIRRRSCPTATVSSSCARSSTILPAIGALTETSICVWYESNEQCS